ncbi:MAG: hypothetical protein AAFQ82_23115, partial [Myxococcota bacterium]
MDLRDRFETRDGSRPVGPGLDAAHARSLPLPALRLLEGGDVFESVGARAKDARDEVLQWLAARVDVVGDGASLLERDAIRLLGASPALLTRLLAAKPLTVYFVEPKQNPSGRGLPRALRHRAAGLFWDHPEWPRARIYYRK